MEELHRIMYGWRDSEFPCPAQVHHSPKHLQVFINQEALQTPNFGDLWRVDHVDIIDHYLYFQPFSLLKRMGDRAEESKFQTMTWSFW